jgi:hypothetical protein
VLRAWIDQGAVWPDETHWAFIKPTRYLPAERIAWARNEIDHFIPAH